MSGVASALWERRGSPIGPLRLLGSALGFRGDSFLGGVAGACLHAILALLVAPVLYALAFHSIGRAEAGVGLIVAIPHALLALMLLRGLAHRQRARDGAAVSPRADWSPLATLAVVLSHLLYGVIVGYIYVAGA